VCPKFIHEIQIVHFFHTFLEPEVGLSTPLINTSPLSHHTHIQQTPNPKPQTPHPKPKPQTPITQTLSSPQVLEFPKPGPGTWRAASPSRIPRPTDLSLHPHSAKSSESQSRAWTHSSLPSPSPPLRLPRPSASPPQRPRTGHKQPPRAEAKEGERCHARTAEDGRIYSRKDKRQQREKPRHLSCYTSSAFRPRFSSRSCCMRSSSKQADNYPQATKHPGRADKILRDSKRNFHPRLLQQRRHSEMCRLVRSPYHPQEGHLSEPRSPQLLEPPSSIVLEQKSFPSSSCKGRGPAKGRWGIQLIAPPVSMVLEQQT
jgi:hypothetical protein